MRSGVEWSTTLDLRTGRDRTCLNYRVHARNTCLISHGGSILSTISSFRHYCPDSRNNFAFCVVYTDTISSDKKMMQLNYEKLQSVSFYSLYIWAFFNYLQVNNTRLNRSLVNIVPENVFVPSDCYQKQCWPSYTMPYGIKSNISP